MIKAQRFAENPIIRPEMLPGEDGGNINGPSLIRVPDWLHAMGRYYLYFAHHQGKYIRLAYADNLHGPWRVYEPGALRLDQSPCRHHIASPDVHVDHKGRLIMYYHGLGGNALPHPKVTGQKTLVATSTDGLNWTSGRRTLAGAYARAWQYGGWWYLISMGGRAWRSRDPLGVFEQGPRIVDVEESDELRMRHPAVRLCGDRLEVYFSRIGDAPERIRRVIVALGADWTQWRHGPMQDVLVPEAGYEGADLPMESSKAGRARSRVREVRDPGVFAEDGRAYLLYSIGGESGLAMAELIE